MSTVFVVGGSGFVGSHTVKELISRGHRVLALARSEASADLLRRAGAEPVLGDLGEVGVWKAVLREAEVVVDTHQVRTSGHLTVSAAEEMLNRRRIYTSNLLAALKAEAINLQGYILLGGIDDYASVRGGWIDENTPLATVPRGFGRVGVPLHKLFEEAVRELGLPLIDLHAGLIYGPGGWFKDGVLNLMRKGQFALMGSGSNYFGLIHVEDVAQAIAAAVQRLPVGQRINLVDDEPVPQRAFIRAAAAAFGLKSPRLHVPLWLAALFGGRVAVETFTNSTRVGNEKMKSLLGVQLRYPTYREGLRRTASSLVRCEVAREN